MLHPSDLPWWGWLLCGGGGILVALIAAVMTDRIPARNWLLVWFVGMAAKLTGLIAFAIGIIRFVKWAWT
jgi:hypothetical protein